LVGTIGLSAHGRRRVSDGDDIGDGICRPRVGKATRLRRA